MGLLISALWDSQSVDQLSPVVQRSFSTNLGLNVNSSSLLLCSKAFCWIIFSILFRAYNHLPWSQRFFLKFFFAKERASCEAATTSHEAVRRALVPYRDFVTHCRCFAACSLSLANKTFKRNLWDQGTNHQIVDKQNETEFALEAFISEFKFALVLGYLNLALNNPALV